MTILGGVKETRTARPPHFGGMGVDFNMPFRPTLAQITSYANNDDYVMLFNAFMLAVCPTFRE